jgi:hypothetical protein
MKCRLLSLSAVVLVGTMLLLVSCESVPDRPTSSKKRGYGPPPHAPAHGHRHKQHGLELVYDSGRGVYVVVELPHHYYYKGRYYRILGNQWQVGIHIDGPWQSVSEKSLPPGLRAGQRGKGKRK